MVENSNAQIDKQDETSKLAQVTSDEIPFDGGGFINANETGDNFRE